MNVAAMWRRARGLNAGEWRAFAAACALHAVIRLLVTVWPLDRIAALTACRPAPRPSSIALPRLAELVRWSTRVCHGTCLSESFVLRALFARQGTEVPVLIGVSGTRDGFRAHAWAGEDAAPGFAPLWSSADRRAGR